MATANIMSNTISIASEEVLPNGVRVITLDYNGSYDEFKSAPASLMYNNVVYGKTGHNSDTGRIYYRTDAKVAYYNQRNQP